MCAETAVLAGPRARRAFLDTGVAGDFRPDESKMGPIFGRWFKEGWHMQASVYPKGWKSALEKWREEAE